MWFRISKVSPRGIPEEFDSVVDERSIVCCCLLIFRLGLTPEGIVWGTDERSEE